MTVCKHVITKLPYVNSERTLSNDTVRRNTGFTLCFAFRHKPGATLPILSSGFCKPRRETGAKGSEKRRSGRIEALGHQQVVCFYCFFCNTAPAQIVAVKTKKQKKQAGLRARKRTSNRSAPAQNPIQKSLECINMKTQATTTTIFLLVIIVEMTRRGKSSQLQFNNLTLKQGKESEGTPSILLSVYALGVCASLHFQTSDLRRP